jgi:two-component system, response regulator PdtaR
LRVKPSEIAQAGILPETVTVLVAEDEFLIRLDVAEELRRVGWKVIEVSSADEAIDLLRSTVIVDLVLTDVNMPGQTNGLDLARFVAREKPNVRVAIMSGHFTGEPVDAQCDLVIPKPFLHSQLVEQLRPLLEGTGEDS